MKKYSFTIEIPEGNDEFWEDINSDVLSNPIEVLSLELIASLDQMGFHGTRVKLMAITEEVTTYLPECQYYDNIDLERYLKNE